MIIRQILTVLSTTILLTACGGGGSSNDSPANPPVVKSTVSLSTVELQAFEKDNIIAKIRIQRTGATDAISVSYTTTSHSDSTLGVASSADYNLVYSDGGDVGTEFHLPANENSRVIEVRPVVDGLHEVPEYTTFTLTSGTNYQLGAETSANVEIRDATNGRENAKVFVGTFRPQDGAATNATGVLSLILDGDNENATLNYTFSGLTSAQTDQHIHVSPSGTVIKDVEHFGALNDFIWDLAPGGFYTTEQQMLDALFAGEFYINIHTANYPSGEISAPFIYDADIEPPDEITLTQVDIDSDVIRFLTQATYGATPESYEDIRSQINEDGSNRIQVYENWINQQMQLPQLRMLDFVDELHAKFPEQDGFNIRRDVFWPMSVYGKDQLRQRVTFALSQILVVGDGLSTIRKAHRGLSDYWDTLAENAFGTYRQTLSDVSRHAIMGIWLSHLRNKKADEALGYFPDENYAREVMQLFSFGLLQRNQNGSIKIGTDNLPVSTYDNEVISEMARVFTGLSFSSRNQDGNVVANNYFSLGNATNEYQYRWTEPMKFFTNYHDFGQKTLFTDNGQTIIIPASSDESVASADAELDLVLDHIVEHSTTAPFISRQLIQRMVTSNPSSGYIERVANAFGNDGDMTAVVKAILLDPEARNPVVYNSKTFGKVKEPLLRLTALMRLFGAGSEIPLGNGSNGLNLSTKDMFDTDATLMRPGNLDSLAQRALASPSVFNFYLPDHSPAGDLSAQSLVAPELQLMTETNLYQTMNILHSLINNGLLRNNALTGTSYTRDQLRTTLNISALESIWQSTNGSNEDKATALIDYLDLYLNSAQLVLSENVTTRNSIINNVATAPSNERYDVAIYGMLNAPELLVQK